MQCSCLLPHNQRHCSRGQSMKQGAHAPREWPPPAQHDLPRLAHHAPQLLQHPLAVRCRQCQHLRQPGRRRAGGHGCLAACHVQRAPRPPSRALQGLLLLLCLQEYTMRNTRSPGRALISLRPRRCPLPACAPAGSPGWPAHPPQSSRPPAACQPRPAPAGGCATRAARRAAAAPARGRACPPPRGTGVCRGVSTWHNRPIDPCGW